MESLQINRVSFHSAIVAVVAVVVVVVVVGKVWKNSDGNEMRVELHLIVVCLYRRQFEFETSEWNGIHPEPTRNRPGTDPESTLNRPACHST